MIVCPQCHHNNPEAHKFCLNCGFTLEIAEVVAPLTGTSSLDLEGIGNLGNLEDLAGEETWVPRSEDLPPTPAELAAAASSPVLPAADHALEDDEDITWIPEKTNRPVPQVSTAAEAKFKEPIWAVVLYPCEANSAWLDCQGVTLPKLFEQDTQRRTNESYLDQHQRYRCLTTFNYTTTTGRVLDTQPQRPTMTAPLHQALLTLSDSLDLNQPDTFLAKLTEISEGPGVTPLVVSYLGLRLALTEFIPEVHNAWVGYIAGQEGQGDPQQIILLQDRSEYISLWDAWQDLNLDHAQLLAWMEEITDLWSLLEAWGCGASLLDETNLCITPDGLLGIRRLDFQPVSEPSHTGLVQLWQTLLSQAPPERQEVFTPLQVALNSQPPTSLESLKALVDQLWDTLQSALIALDDAAELDLDDISASLDVTWRKDLDLTEEVEDAPTAVLPKQLVHLEATGLTDTGRQRHHNEDFYLIEQQQHYIATSIGQKLEARGVYVLCDGMGGHAQGEVASSMAAKTLFEYFQQHWPLETEIPEDEVIRQGIFQANQAIFEANENQRSIGSGRMGTTLVLGLLHNQQFCVAHVGDSRVYRYTRRQGLEPLTSDHEVGQRDINRGVEPEVAYARPDAYQLTQALGPRGNDYISPDIHVVEVTDDTLFLLCSDGLTDNQCLEAHVETHLAPLLNFDLSLTKGVRNLIHIGNEHNGHDNLTVIAVRLKLRSELDTIF